MATVQGPNDTLIFFIAFASNYVFVVVIQVIWMLWNILFMAPIIKLIVILNLLSREFVETVSRSKRCIRSNKLAPK